MSLLMLGIFQVVFGFAQGWKELGADSSALNANDKIWALCSDASGNIYAGGSFTDSTDKCYVAKWDGNSWIKLGPNALHFNGMDGQILALCVDSSRNVYAAGNFLNSTGHPYVAKWDGNSWTELGAGVDSLNASNTILTLKVDINSNVYAAGYFKNSAQYYYVAKWDGNIWSDLGGGINSPYSSETINDIELDAAGNVYAAGDFPAVLKWDGSSWTELGTGTNALNAYSIHDLTIDASNNIYATGFFYTNVPFVAKWDGTTWTELGAASNPINSYAIPHICNDPSGALYESIFIPNNSYVARWNGNFWDELGQGANALKAKSMIEALISDNTGNIYAAGYFTNDNDKYYVAKYEHQNIPNGVADVKKDWGLKLFPNPAINNLNLQMSADHPVLEISILDIYGRTIIEQKVGANKMRTSIEIDIKALSSGMYLINVLGKGISLSHKFEKIR